LREIFEEVGKMKKALAVLLLVLASYAGPVTLVRAAEEQKPATPEQKPAAPEDKPLGPGWLSLDCCVGPIDNAIGNGKGALEKALGISISGFLDTSYTWSSNHPRSPTDISGRYFDKDHNKIDFNDFNLTIEKPEKDWGVGFKVVGDFGRTAELLREATLWNKKFQKQPSAELREAFLTTTIPIGEGLQIKAGKFVTLMGTEVIPAPGSYNPNISRSFLFNYAIPFTHLGALFSYPVLKTLTIMGGPVTGWDNPHDNNSSPSFHGGFTFTPAEVFSLATSVMAGPEQSHNTNRTRFTISNVATIKPVSDLTLFLEYSYGHEEKVTASLRDGTWQGVAGIASYDWTERFNTALRAEWFNDRDGSRLGGDFLGNHANVAVGEMTLTGAYKFTKMLLGRAEVRQDWSDQKFYKRGSSNADKNQTTLGLQLVYQY
jgi:putative OmpL-like beta-barrel porin-2